jgi:transitional endoplasmic reticulum ATPase
MLEIDNVIMQQSDSESAATVIKNIFYRAYENKPAIIFIDEVDGIVPKRRNSAQKDIEVTTELLKDMDGIKRMSQIIVVGATNRPEALDEAVLRPGRFDKIVFIKPPDAHQRALLFKEYIKNAPYDKSIDFEKLGAETKGFTGADIANVCREVKMHALESHIKTSKESVIGIEDIENVLKTIKPSAPESALSVYLAFLAKYGQR